jgi:ribosome recycling factor
MIKYNNLSKDLGEVIDFLKKELRNISAGAANPAVLDSINVESYGSYMQVSHLANIALEDSRTIKISPFDKSQTKAIEAAIREADLGFSIVAESDGVRLIVPQMTTESRQKYVKMAKEKLEDARIKVRKERQEAMDEIDEVKKEGGSEDEYKKQKENIQKFVDATNGELEALFKHKEETITTI